MADSTPYPLFQGNAFSWPSAEFDIIGMPRLGIIAVNWNANIDIGEVRGAGSNVIAFTQGNTSFDGDFEMLLHQFDQMIAGLGPNWMANTIGDIVSKWSEDLAGFDPIVETMRGVRITQVGAATQSSSVDGVTRKCTFKYLQHLVNGVPWQPAQPTSTS